MKGLRRKRNRLLALACLFGMLMLLGGYHLSNWKSLQSENFNAGLTAYNEGSMLEAVQFFDRSLSTYRDRASNENVLTHYIYPTPDRGLAARAYFQKAKALLALEQPEAALEAYRESLLLNPGNGYSNIALETVTQLEREARYTQYDLELLFANDEKLGQQEGKSSQDDKPGNSQVPGSEPGSQPGNGDPKSI